MCGNWNASEFKLTLVAISCWLLVSTNSLALCFKFQILYCDISLHYYCCNWQNLLATVIISAHKIHGDRVEIKSLLLFTSVVTGSPPYAFFPNTVEMWTLKSSSVHYWDLPMCLLTWRILDYFVLNTQYVNAWMSGMDWHSKHYLCKSRNRRVEGKWKGGGVGRRKKDDFVFLWGQCLLEGNDTIDSFHSHANHHDILFLWLDTMHPPKLPIPQHDFQTVHVGVGVKAQEQCSCYAYMMCLWMLLHTVCKMLQDSRIHNITAQYKTSI